MNQKELTTLRDAMIDRAVEAIRRSDALLERTRQVLHHAETLAAKDEAAPAAPKVMK